MGAAFTDSRLDQAERVADFLESNPGATTREIDAACDTGSVTKVLSDMSALGYRLGKNWRNVTCADGVKTRRVRTWWLKYRPEFQSNQRELFD